MEDVCNPAWCTLYLPSDVEFNAILNEANRIIAKYGGDYTSTGRQCSSLGLTMRDHIGEVRMTNYEWSATDPSGARRAVPGDFHQVELAPSTGRVHIAENIDSLNPRSLPEIVATARHEFGHMTGLGQGSGGIDPAGQLAAACAP